MESYTPDCAVIHEARFYDYGDMLQIRRDDPCTQSEQVRIVTLRLKHLSRRLREMKKVSFGFEKYLSLLGECYH